MSSLLCYAKRLLQDIRIGYRQFTTNLKLGQNTTVYPVFGYKIIKGIYAISKDNKFVNRDVCCMAKIEIPAGSVIIKPFTHMIGPHGNTYMEVSKILRTDKFKMISVTPLEKVDVSNIPLSYYSLYKPVVKYEIDKSVTVDLCTDPSLVFVEGVDFYFNENDARNYYYNNYYE